MIKQKALYIAVNTKEYVIKEIADKNIIGAVDFGFSEFLKGNNSFCFGCGLFAGSVIPGTRRLIFTGHSPIWDNFYISTMGGAALVFRKLGINYVAIKGICDKPTILKLKRKNGKLSVSFDKVDVNTVWKDYQGLKGTYALQKYVLDKYKEEFEEFRIIVAGPASALTKIGALMSAPVEKKKITAVDCWAGRGGIGSSLVQEHNIVAIVYGGDFEDNKELKDMSKINEVFNEKLGKTMIKADQEATVKYRYDESVKSGGTFGVNFSKLKSWAFMFNYNSIYWTEEKRLEIYNKLIKDHYLKQFNEETIEKKQFKHCGEPCSAVCKKMNGQYKKDYEPYESLGPNCGIFDQRAAELVTHHADSMGFDAIQIGSMVSWIMDIIDKGLIKKENFGLKSDFHFDVDNFDVINHSMLNSKAAIEIMNMILFSAEGFVFRLGLRQAAKELDLKYKIKSINHAAFNAYSDNGCMVPNQYWVPGMYSPMPIMGKYFSYYGSDFMDPKRLGMKNAQRFVYELYSDNFGICRFHRSWVEKILPDLIEKFYGEKIDLFKHHKKIVTKLNEDNKSVYWETQKVKDIVKTYLEKIAKHEVDKITDVDHWVERFSKDKEEAAKAYWYELLDGINEELD